MRTLPFIVVLIVAVITIAANQPWATAQPAKPADPPIESVTCVEPVETFAGKSAEQWRAEGPQGLAKLIEAMKPSIHTYIRSTTRPNANPSPEAVAQLAQAQANILFIDQVAQQRDAYISKLYWYTDLDAATAQAKRTSRPILSLRMLGKLVDEYSCANSRFFRTALYADRNLSEFLREKYVLHWQSVRPVPVITIDMGDGRTIKRTITGNSAHYVLDQHGRVIDCLPGLYGSGTFARVLAGSYRIAQSAADKDDKPFTEIVRNYHLLQASMLDARWSRLTSSDANNRLNQIQALQAQQVKIEHPNARKAGLVTAGKRIVEMPMVNALLPGAVTPEAARDDQALWDRVARAYAEEAKLDPMSQAMMRRKTVTAEDAARRSHMKGRVEDPLMAMVRNFENAIALDTARNEHLLRRELCKWFVAAEGPLDLGQFNSRVYAELFLTPDDDPWLGLVPADTYSALDSGGLSN